MIISDVVQGTPEWIALRRGIPTASRFDEIVMASGEPSKQREKYLYELAGERLGAVQQEGYKNSAMAWGNRTEPEARKMYEFLNDVTVKTVGLCFKDEKKLFACSPDFLTENGGGEIKCPEKISIHVERMIKGVFPTEFVQQVQGAMFICDLPHYDWMSYYPGLEPIVIRVKRDDGFISKLSEELDRFCKELDLLTKKLKGEK